MWFPRLSAIKEPDWSVYVTAPVDLLTETASAEVAILPLLAGEFSKVRGTATRGPGGFHADGGMRAFLPDRRTGVQPTRMFVGVRAQ